MSKTRMEQPEALELMSGVSAALKTGLIMETERIRSSLVNKPEIP